MKKAHPAPLDAAHSAAAVRALAAYAGRVGLSPNGLLSRLAEMPGRDDLHEDTESKLGLCDFSPAPNTLRSALRSQKPPNAWATYAIYLWMREDNYQELMDLVLEETTQHETAVRALKGLLGHDGVLNFQRVKAYKGEYRLFRPYHLAPCEQIIVAGLTIGSKASPFDCMIRYLSRDEFGEPKQSLFTGKIVPHGHRMMAVLTSTGNPTSNYILHFDAEWDGADPEVLNLNGIMIAAVGPHPASAWPVFARRAPGPVTPTVIDRAEYADLPRPVRDALGRGAIHWRPDDYPWPFGRVEATAS